MIMKKKNLSFILIASGLLFLSSLKAQDTLTLNLPKSIEIALDQNPTIRIAEKEITRVDYSNKEKFAALLPSINGQASYSRTLKKQKLFFNIPGMPVNPEGIEVGQDNSFAGVLSVQMPLISPTLWSSLKLNDMEASLMLENARASRLSLVNSVTKAYYAALLANDSYGVIEKTVQSNIENAKIIHDKFKQGQVSEFEWIRADVQLRNAQTNLVSAESAMNMSKLQIKLLLGLEMDQEIKLMGSLKDFENEVFGQMLKAGASDLESSTDLSQFDIKANQLKQALKIQKSQWLPTLAASLNYQYMASPNDDVAIKDYYWFPTSNAGLSLNIPIFQGGAKHYKAKQLQIQLSELEDQRSSLKKSLELQSIALTDNMIKAIEKIESGKKALSQAEKSVSISQKMYEVGNGTFLDVSNAELGYIQAGLSYNQAIYDFLSSKSDLEKLLGTSLENQK